MTKTVPKRKTILAPGESRWHGLIVYPQREGASKAWLEEHGVYSFYPVTRKVIRFRGREIGRSSRYIPGYLFANFHGEPLWWRILGTDRRLIRNVIRMHDGTPGWLHEETLARLLAMREVDEVLEAKQKAARTIRKGARVRIKAGPFRDFTDVEVVDVKGTQGIVHIQIFGRITEVEIGLDGLEKIA